MWQKFSWVPPSEPVPEDFPAPAGEKRNIMTFISTRHTNDIKHYPIPSVGDTGVVDRL
jgi:hypothetical protein